MCVFHISVQAIDLLSFFRILFVRNLPFNISSEEVYGAPREFALGVLSYDHLCCLISIVIAFPCVQIYLANMVPYDKCGCKFLVPRKSMFEIKP
jgi:hypothetical protein